MISETTRPSPQLEAKKLHENQVFAYTTTKNFGLTKSEYNTILKHPNFIKKNNG